MHDIETRLRNLYEDIDVRTPRMNPGTLRRIKVRRASKMVAIGAVVASSVVGISFATDVFQTDRRPSQPATEPTAISTPVIVVASTEDARTTLGLQRDLGIVCHVSSPPLAGLKSLQVVRANENKSPIVDLFPPASPVANTRGICTGNVDAATIDSIVETPDQFLLSYLIDGEPRVFSNLSLLPASPMRRDRCRMSVRFEPTYLPPEWTKQLQPSSELTDAEHEVLGYYGSDAPRTSSRLKKAGVATLMRWPLSQMDTASPELTVLGQDAALVRQGSTRYGVVFSYRGCGYALIAIGVTKAALIDFAESLVPAETAGR
jgi:hypothetical protein